MVVWPATLDAVTHGTGRVPVRDMIRAGLLVNILGWAVIIAVAALTPLGMQQSGSGPAAASLAHHGRAG